MDSLMAALVASLLIRLTDRSADWTAGTAERTGKPGAMLGGAAIALVVTHAISAAAGWWVGEHITDNPKRLMLGLALIAAATGAIWPGKAKEPAAGQPMFATLSHLIATGLGGRGEFVVFALATGTSAVLAGVGGVIGSIVILAAAAIMGEQLWRPLPHRAIGYGVALLLAGTGIWLGLSAIRLI